VDQKTAFITGCDDSRKGYPQMTQMFTPPYRQGSFQARRGAWQAAPALRNIIILDQINSFPSDARGAMLRERQDKRGDEP
jgi:hypothetical protein